jgi:membrane protease subunit (stomatin/prohibitin family)
MGAIGDMNAYLRFKAARAMGDAALSQGGSAAEGLGLGAGVGLGAGLAGTMAQAMQQGQQAPPPAPPSTAPPAPPAATEGGALTRAQIQQAIEMLDLRFSNGEISEQTYNRMAQRWEARLKELEA